MTLPTKYIAVAINCSSETAYAFASNPEHLPRWAGGLSGGMQQIDGRWISESPMGRVEVAFAPANPFGVLDHHVTLPDGKVFYNPMRVFANADGCEIVFTLFRQPEMSDEDFAADAEQIQKDLRQLKALLE